MTPIRRVRPDPDLEQQNLKAMKDLLVKNHKFGLKPADLAGSFSIEYVYSVFVDAGLTLDYSTGGRGAGGNNPTYEDLMEIDDGTGADAELPGNEENYRFVRDMEKKNLIVPLVGDFAGPKTIRAVGEYLRDHDATVDGLLSFERRTVSLQRLHVRRFLRQCRDAASGLPAARSYVRSAEVASAGALEADSSDLYRLCLR